MTDIERTIQRLKNEGLKFGIVLNPPATEGELVDFKNTLQVDLPADLIEFYKKCNGFESDDYLFRVIPLKEIIENKNEFEPDTFSFAEYMIYADTWNIKLNANYSNSYTIVNRNHNSNEPVKTWNSLHSFLNEYLDRKGLFGEQGILRD